MRRSRERRMYPPRNRHGDEQICRFGLLGYHPHLLRADPNGFLGNLWIPGVDDVTNRLGHIRVASESENKIRLDLLEHLPVVSEGWRILHGLRATPYDGGI